MAIPMAEIYLPALNRSTETDEKGNFSLCNIPCGIYNLQVKRLGYAEKVISLNVTEINTLLQIELEASPSEFSELVVYGNQDSRAEETANDIVSLSSFQMREYGALTLSEGISKLPGVNQLTTGGGISKPVIRGLFGNRIQTILMGLRFDNQQWQDEHGLGLSDVGVERIEIIKGPASLLYGSEAMGGVLNIIEEKPASMNKTVADYSLRAFNNTYGFATDAGVKSANKKLNWRVRLGTESHADYSDGNNLRILNTRFAGYFTKASIGFNRKNWMSKNDYMFSLSNFGFIMDASQLNFQADERLSRNFEMPHHSVFLNILSSQNTFFLNNSKVKWNIGFQSNNRQEQEGGSKISLNMILTTYLFDLCWIKNIGKHSEFTLGTSSFYQTNRNIGSRTIIPDAVFFESSAYSYFKHVKKYFAFEMGLRYDAREIKTYKTGTINTDPLSPGSSILPFKRWYSALNGSVGISIFDNTHWNFKTNFSSGYRPGNLAELSSNGLHEGTIRYEIGNIDLKIEQNICADASLAYKNKWITASISTYANRFFNYIYLAPTNTEYIGFQIFRYVQKNSLLKGFEAASEMHSQKIKQIILHLSYSTILGKTDAGEFLPFIPAQKISPELKYLLLTNNSHPFLRVGMDYVFDQNRPGQFETSTPSYWLLNAGLGWEKDFLKKNIFIGLSGNNLLNTEYYDHLSRYKYFGIYNMGRNMALNFKIKFN